MSQFKVVKQIKVRDIEVTMLTLESVISMYLNHPKIVDQLIMMYNKYTRSYVEGLLFWNKIIVYML